MKVHLKYIKQEWMKSTLVVYEQLQAIFLKDIGVS